MYRMIANGKPGKMAEVILVGVSGEDLCGLLVAHGKVHPRHLVGVDLGPVLDDAFDHFSPASVGQAFPDVVPLVFPLLHSVDRLPGAPWLPLGIGEKAATARYRLETARAGSLVFGQDLKRKTVFYPLSACHDKDPYG